MTGHTSTTFLNGRVSRSFLAFGKVAGRLFGAPINLTSRLADQAMGGQILCSTPIAEAVQVLAEVEARPVGERHFRNVTHAVNVFELLPSVATRKRSAVDPVCRMRIDVERTQVHVQYAGATYYFCSPECAQTFSESPELFISR